MICMSIKEKCVPIPICHKTGSVSLCQSLAAAAASFSSPASSIHLTYGGDGYWYSADISNKYYPVLGIHTTVTRVPVTQTTCTSVPVTKTTWTSILVPQTITGYSDSKSLHQHVPYRLALQYAMLSYVGTESGTRKEFVSSSQQ